MILPASVQVWLATEPVDILDSRPQFCSAHLGPPPDRVVHLQAASAFASRSEDNDFYSNACRGREPLTGAPPPSILLGGLRQP